MCSDLSAGMAGRPGESLWLGHQVSTWEGERRRGLGGGHGPRTGQALESQ